MSDKILKYMIASVIVMLLIFQIGTLIAGILGAVWGIASAVTVAAVSILSAHLAKISGKYSMWFLAPTLIFTVIPIGSAVWRAFTEDVSWTDHIVDLAPFFIGFGLPILLLLLVYYELHKRTSE